MVFLSLTALVVFKSGVVESAFPEGKQDFGKSLLPSVAIQGMVRQKDLSFTSREIKRINFAAIKHRNQFEKLNFHLNYAAKSGGRAIGSETLLVMNVQLEVDGGGEICSWGERVKRKDMVPEMVRYLNKAAIELDRCQKMEGSKKTFKRLYI